MMSDLLSGDSREKFNELLAEDVDRNFPAFAKAYEAPLRSYIIGRGADLSDVDDITHDALIRMHFWLKDCYPQKIRESNLKAYFYRIVDNCVRVKQREYRKRYSSPRFQDSSLTEADIFDELIDEEKRPKGPEDIYLYEEWRQELFHYLPEDYRQVVNAYLDGWSFQEIAAQLRTSTNSVKYIWRQSRKILQSVSELRH